MLKRETERTALASLKIASNNGFRVIIFEVRNTHKDKVPKIGSESRPW